MTSTFTATETAGCIHLMSKKSTKKMWRGSASCSWFIVCYFGTHQARLDSLGKLFLQGINIPTLHHELRAILKLHLQGGTRWTQSPFPAPGTPGASSHGCLCGMSTPKLRGGCWAQKVLLSVLFRHLCLIQDSFSALWIPKYLYSSWPSTSHFYWFLIHILKKAAFHLW